MQIVEPATIVATLPAGFPACNHLARDESNGAMMKLVFGWRLALHRIFWVKTRPLDDFVLPNKICAGLSPPSLRP